MTEQSTARITDAGEPSAIGEFLRGFPAKWLPRLAGVTAGYLVGEGAKHGLALDQELTTAIMTLVYFVVHRLLSRWLNPGDATRTPLIKKDKATVAASASDGVGAPAAPAQPVASPESEEIRAALEQAVARQRGE